MRGLALVSAGLSLGLLGGCTTEGSFDLELVLPTDPALRPTGMTTVTVTLTSEGAPPVSTTSVLDGNSFSAGDLAVADDVKLSVQLRDVSNRLVGVGEAPDLIDIVGSQATAVSIPVRRPFVYASNGSSLLSFDPTLDATDTKFQGQISGVSSPRVAVSVGGDRLAIVSSSQVSVIATDTNQVVGSPITLSGETRDATAIPNSRRIAIAGDNGITVVDIDTGAMTTTQVSGVDRITVGPAQDGRMIVHGLIGRVQPEVNPLLGCTGSSSIVQFDVDAAPQSVTPQTLPEPVSDLAAAPENVGLFATLPCSGKVVRIQGDIETGNATFEDFATLPRAAAVAVAGGRVIAAGTQKSTPVCQDQNGMTSCRPDSSTSCSGGVTQTAVAFVSDGAHLVVLSSPLDGGMPITIDLPDRRETIVDTGDDAQQHAQVLNAFGTTPIDLVALPGGQHVAVITQSNYVITALRDNLGNPILPCLNATTADWLLVDLATTSVAQRVRTSCGVDVGPSTVFPQWGCDVPPPGERSSFGEYTPTSVGALFGAR